MGRNKLDKDIKKGTRLFFRIETSFKKDYKNHCDNMKLTIAERLRYLMILDINNKISGADAEL